MFARVFTVLALAAVAVAAPAAPAASDSCNSGAEQCCEQVQPASSINQDTPGGVLSLIPIALQGLNIPIGLSCTPISVLAIAGGSTCQQQTVCCENNSFNGVIALGCSPIGIPIA